MWRWITGSCVLAVVLSGLVSITTSFADAPQIVPAPSPAAAPGSRPVSGSGDEAAATEAAPAEAVAWAPAVDPKPLSDHVKNGLAWLVQHQNPDGGWGQGEESSQMGHGMDSVRDISNVADTAVATLALIRAGSTPTDGPHHEQINKALAFICNEVEKADGDSLWITSVRGTRVQGKIGQYIDTFLAAMLLAEVKDKMPDDLSNQRVFAALDKTMDKIERNQRADGSWDNQGWAGGLGAAMGNKALNRAAQSGFEVNEEALDRAQMNAQGQAKPTAEGKFKDDGRSAGVELYSAASAVGGLADASNTNRMRRAEVQEEAEAARGNIEQLRVAVTTAPTQPERDRVVQQLDQENAKLEASQKKLDEFEAADKDLDAAKQALVQRMQDEGFVAGFGNNGGEEFLSYLQIGETLVVDGGDAFRQWDEDMTKNLNHIQNSDGSWTGHHCITGRTFCTSAALLVLTVDRAPVPVAKEMRRR